MAFKLRNKQGGFSLVELMIVVGIIGILAAMLTPKLQVFLAKGRQAEAKMNLGTIYTLQVSYYSDNNAYAAMTAIGRGSAATACTNSTLGLDLGSGCGNMRYQYSTTSATATAFAAQAVAAAGGICPWRASAADLWTMDDGKALAATLDCTR
jgi:type IV pilus assembly protein PilA